MKKKYWLSALILFGLGLFFYFFVYAYQFTGLLLCALGVLRLVFGLLNLCKRKIFSMILSVCVVVGIVLMIATGIWIGVHAGGTEDSAADYVVVLGAGVNGTQPSASLRERLEAAQSYLEQHPEAVLILSGAQGNNEDITEAQCMYTWLTERGVPSERLRIEEQATTTQENIRYSLELIERETGRKPGTIGIISSEYHLLRASLIAEELDVESVCYPAETQNKFYFCNMYLREIFGIWAYYVGYDA